MNWRMRTTPPKTSPRNCSCAHDKQISNIEDQSGQNADTVDTSNASGVHGKEEGLSEQSLDKGVAVKSATIEPSAMPIEKQGLSKDASVAGNAWPPSSPPDTTVAVNSQGLGTKTGQSLKSPITTEPSLPSPEDKKSESLQDSNKKNSQTEQPSDNKQTSADPIVVIQEFAKTETRPPVIPSNVQAQALQPFDPVMAAQQPAGAPGGLEQQQQPPTPPNLPINNHPAQIPESGSKPPLTEPLDDKMKDKSNMSEAESRTSDSNQQNFDPFDYVVPAILIVLAGLLFMGVIKSSGDQNKNKQPEAQTEVVTRTDSNSVANRKKKPPSLYSIQPQGETAGTRIF